MTIRKSTRPIPNFLLLLSPDFQQMIRQVDDSDNEPRPIGYSVTIRDLLTVFGNSRAIAAEARKLQLKNEKDREEFEVLHKSMSRHTRATVKCFVLALLERAFAAGGSWRLYSHAVVDSFLAQADTFVCITQIAVTEIGWEEYREFFDRYLGFAI